MNKTLLLTSASAFALILGASAPAFAVEDGARASAEGTSADNNAYDDGSQRDNLIDNSFIGGATGIVHDQQNNGSNNAINAATAVHADVTGGTGLETGATATSTSDDNYSDHDGDGDDRNNEILGTMNGFVGSATIQQNNGDNNAINAATVLDGVDGNTAGVLQEVSAEADTVDGETRDDSSSDRDNLIDPSFNGAAGVFTVQQNNGDGNAISAATAAFGVTGDAGGLEQDVSADAEADDNETDSYGDDRYNTVTDSFNGGFAGVATVQQNNGDGNAMSAATGVAAVGGNAGNLTQHAIANGFGDGAIDNDTDAENSERYNTIGGDYTAFQGAHGVLTVQQNNGDANAVSAANAVAGHVGAAGDIHQGTGVALGFSGAAGNYAGDDDGTRENLINTDSFNDASGVITAQQNNGDANSMGAATTVAGVTGDSGAVDQHARNGFFLTGAGWNGADGDLDTDFSERHNLVDGAMNDMTGVATVQQNNGNANNIGAGTGMIGVGGTSGDVLQEITAGTGASGSAFNETEEVEGDQDNKLNNTFKAHEGIATVQQNNGDANNMVALTTVTMTGAAGKVTQKLSADNMSLDNDVEADESDRDNDILSESFDGLRGVATVQQNNGDANSIVAMTGAVVVAGDSGNIKQRINVFGASEDNVFEDLNESDRENDIDGALNDVQGVVTVQQNNGSGNAMTAATGLVANTGGAGDVKQTVKAGGRVDNNESLDKYSERDNDIDDSSFADFMGIATVQQNNGDGNVINAATGVALNTGDGKLDDIDQKVKTKGVVIDSYAKDVDDTDDDAGERGNILHQDIFERAVGVVTVQQNNGDNNVMAGATGVRAELNSTESSSEGDDDVSRQLASTKGKVINNKGRAVDKDDDDYARINDLTDAFQGGVDGVFTVQQNNGNNNVIGSSVAVAANINSADDIDSAMENLAHTQGKVKDNSAKDIETSRDNYLNYGVFDDGAGIFTVQQNNGDNNVMGSAVGVVANVNTGFRFGNAVTADATGDATVKKNKALSEDVFRHNHTEEVMIGTQGIMTVQQNHGSNNVIGAATDVVVTTETPGFGPAASTASLSATVSGNKATWDDGSGSSELANFVEGAFTGASGIMTVQQNNGDNNAMGSAITAVANGISFEFNN